MGSIQHLTVKRTAYYEMLHRALYLYSYISFNVNGNADTAKFTSGKMSHIIVRGQRCNIIVLNVHAATEYKSNDTKEGFYEELKCVFDQVLRST